MTIHSSRRRAGFTLIEMMVSVSLALLIFAAAVPFFRVQARTVTAHAGRNDAIQNARFAMNAIDRDLRVAGAGIVNPQPLLVQADAYAITFNADLITTDQNEMGAVYYDPTAPLGSTTVLDQARRIVLPRSAIGYPDTTYLQQVMDNNGTPLPSRAETISYWVSPDSTTARTDDHIMFRRVNDLAPMVVAEAIIVRPGEPIFRYYKGAAGGALVEVPQGSLPLVHSAVIHGSNEDIGGSALTDSVRSVRVRISSIYSEVHGDSAIRTAEGSIRLLNSGLIRFASCGEPPLGAALLATKTIINSSPAVRLTWVASVDDGAGERDIDRYAIFRRAGGSIDWGEPFTSVPAGLVTYEFFDTDVPDGDWEYGLIAQDCTPASSGVSTAGPVTIP